MLLARARTLSSYYFTRNCCKALRVFPGAYLEKILKRVNQIKILILSTFQFSWPSLKEMRYVENVQIFTSYMEKLACFREIQFSEARKRHHCELALPVSNYHHPPWHGLWLPCWLWLRCRIWPAGAAKPTVKKQHCQGRSGSKVWTACSKRR